LAWDKDKAAILDCPDLRKESWYPEWATSPAWHSGGGSSGDIDETIGFYMIIDFTSTCEMDLKRVSEEHNILWHDINPHRVLEASYDASIGSELGASED
jgi:hypothetical protein